MVGTGARRSAAFHILFLAESSIFMPTACMLAFDVIVSSDVLQPRKLVFYYSFKSTIQKWLYEEKACPLLRKACSSGPARFDKPFAKLRRVP